MCTEKPFAVTVSYYNDIGTRYGFCWQTLSDVESFLEYTDESDENFLRCKIISAKSIYTDSSCYKNYAETDELSSPKDIWYRIRVKGGATTRPVLLKTPSTTDKTRFVLVADTQDLEHNGEWWNAVLSDAGKVFADYDFIAHAGDIVQTSGLWKEWKAMFENVDSYTRSHPLVAAAGNHDYWSGFLLGHRGTFYNHFHIDIPEQKTDYGAYYSVELGNMFLAVLNTGDSMLTGGELLESQYQWLSGKLQSTEKAWKVILMHNPMYSPGKYGTEIECCVPCLALREQLSGLFEENDVNLVICGHDHIFARTYPVKKNGNPEIECEIKQTEFLGRTAETFLNPQYPIYLEPGCAGNQNRYASNKLSLKERLLFREIKSLNYGEVYYAIIEVEKSELKVLYRVINVQNENCIFESAFGITKD